MPWFTPWLGPWIRPAGGKPANEQLPPSDPGEVDRGAAKAQKTFVSCAPEFQKLMAFHWAGYDLKVGYTYRLTNLEVERRLWNEMRSNVRVQKGREDNRDKP
jgi:hypothetical protein